MNNIDNYILKHSEQSIGLSLREYVSINRYINTIYSQIGLGGTIVGIGVAAAVGEAIAKSDMPALQKVAVAVGSGLTAIVIYLVIIINVY